MPTEARFSASLRWTTDVSSPDPVVAHSLHEPPEMGALVRGTSEVHQRREQSDEPHGDGGDDHGPRPDAPTGEHHHGDQVRGHHRQDAADVGAPHRRDVHDHGDGEQRARDHVAPPAPDPVGAASTAAHSAAAE